MIRKFLIKIHSYLGLFCLPYLLVFGISSLSFNHELPFLEIEVDEVEKKVARVEPDTTLDNNRLALSINKSLDIWGWYIPWNAKRDSLTFTYETQHFGRKYDVDVNFRERSASVTSNPQTLLNMIKGLHFLGEPVPGAPVWINAWQYYQDLSVYSLLFWIFSGIYLWATLKRDRIWGNIILYTMLLLSLTFMMYIWLVG